MAQQPSLQTRYSGYGRSLGTSLISGVLGCLAVAGVLALIVQAHRFIAETNTELPEMTTVLEKPVKKPPKPVTSGPVRLITAPGGPTLVQAPTEEAPQETTEFVEIPEPEQPDLLVLEELDEHPFEEKKEAPPTPKETRTAKVEPKPVQRKGPSKAELEERERRRVAALARKITRDAQLKGSRVQPDYPRSAIRKGLEGVVVVRVTVGPNGRVSSCQISQSSGHAILDRSAVDAARRHRFSPAQNGLGQAVSVTKLMPFKFRLTG